jgi:tripartite-type tricarboxylate transporter receptor subunit TctC
VVFFSLYLSELKMKLLKSLALGSALSLAFIAGAQAQWPEKPITIVVPFAAGGPTDIVARSVADAMMKSLPNSRIIVENVAGAGGTIGVAKVSKAASDGYTLLIHHIGMSTAPALYRRLAFDPQKDFEYVGLISDVPMTLLTKKALPPNNLQELIAYAKANKDKVNVANAGIGSASHLCGLLFMSSIETDMTTVPYKGTAPALTDLRGGQVDILCDQTTNTIPVIKAGEVKALAVTTPKRLSALKDLPTMAEQGLPGASLSVWHGMYAPKGTPKLFTQKLQVALQAALKNPDLVKRFADLGTEPVAADRVTPAALEKHLATEIAKWSPIIKKANIYAD